MLCDATEDIKRVEFDTDLGAFNVYVQYSTALKTGGIIPLSQKRNANIGMYNLQKTSTTIYLTSLALTTRKT